MKISKPFFWVLFLVMAIALQYLFTIYFVTMRSRLSAFNKAFMQQFNDEHSKAFPGQTKAPEYGYPDTGNGRYGMKLAYD